MDTHRCAPGFQNRGHLFLDHLVPKFSFHGSSHGRYRYIHIEVRDSRTGYLIPARYGMGSGQMEKLSARRRRRRRHLENAKI